MAYLSKLFQRYWIVFCCSFCFFGIILAGKIQSRPVGLLVVLVSLLPLVLHSQSPAAPPSPRAGRFSAMIPLALAATLSIAASLLAASLDQQPNQHLERIAVYLWIEALAFIAFSSISINRREVTSWLVTHRRELGILAGLVLVAALLRLIHLGAIPRTMEPDEAWVGMAALKRLPASAVTYNNPFSYFQGFGRIQLSFVQSIVLLLGNTALAVRLLPALVGIAAIPATYLFTRSILGKAAAFVVAVLLTFSHTHIHFSRTAAVAYIYSSVFTPLVLYFFLSGILQQRRQRLVLAGLLLGLHLHFYYGGQAIAGMLVVFTAISSLLRPALIKANFTNLLVFAATTIIIVLPAAVWSVNHPEEFGARWTMEGTFQSGWIARESAMTGQAIPFILADRLAHVVLSIFVLPFQDFYWAPAPVLQTIPAVLFLIGVVVSLRNTTQLPFLLLNGWLWSSILSIAVFVIPPSADSYRLVMALSAMMILAGCGWKRLITLIHPGRLITARSVPAWTVALLCLSALIDLKTYFVDFAKGCRYINGELRGRRSTYIGEYLKREQPFDHAYLLGNEYYRTGIHPSLDYLSGNAPVQDIFEPFVAVPQRGSLVFIIIPSRAEELKVIKTFADEGEVTRVADCNRLSFIGYRVDVE